MLRSRSSGGRLVRSNPRQNTRSTPRPRSMHVGGAVKSTPRKFQLGTGRRGASCPPGYTWNPSTNRCVISAGGMGSIGGY
jgi:hypothetical protein